MSVWYRCLIVAALVIGCLCRAGATDIVLGPARDVALLDQFGMDCSADWQTKAGANVTASTSFNCTLPGIANELMRVTARRSDPADKEPSRNWMALLRAGAWPAQLPTEFDGFRLVLGSGQPVQWWISMSVKVTDGRTFTRLVTDSAFPSGRLVEFLLPLDTFRCGPDSLTPELVRQTRSIEFACNVPGADLYMQKMALYYRSRYTAWLDFATNHPEHNLFEPGEPVQLRFTLGGEPPREATAFTWEVQDLRNVTVQRGVERLASRKAFVVPLSLRRHGYYEVRAWWVNHRGRRLGADSCIRSVGTVPQGVGTFAILPATQTENIARIQRVGRQAFFGMHGDVFGLADRIGLAWRFEYEKWPWLEPSRPERSGGIAEWARQRVAQGPVAPYRLHIMPFRGNMSDEVPEWARRTDGLAPPFADWADYLAMVRDSVRVEMARYPHMTPRLYGGAWESNLNMPPYNATQPPFTPAELVELFRRTRETIRAEDPTALVIGPCPSVLDLAWFESVFDAGLLRYVDAIETHGYSEGAIEPEDNDYPGKIARLNALTERYIGHPLDIYCTELGHPGILGATVIHRAQAERMVRTAVILKGEGVRVLLPFYGIDYDRLGYWGFLFNLDVDAPEGPWFTRRVSPKPLVTAMAACARLLEGARPVARLQMLGTGVWAYRFESDKEQVTVVWKPGSLLTVRVPLTTGRNVRVLDIEGHPLPVRRTGQSVKVRVGASPVYVVESMRPAIN